MWLRWTERSEYGRTATESERERYARARRQIMLYTGWERRGGMVEVEVDVGVEVEEDVEEQVTSKICLVCQWTGI